MKSGKCPKCDGRSVYRGTDVFFKQGAYGSNSIPVSATDSAPLDNYVCTACGYVENYVTDRSCLEDISQKWPRVGGA